MNEADLDALLLGYLFEAAEPSERVLVERLVTSDDQVSARLHAFEVTLQRASANLGPPDHVWDRLAATVFPGEPRVPHPRMLVNRGTTRRRARQALAGLAAAACIAAVAAGTVALTDRGSSPSGLSALSATAQTAPGARIARLTGPDGRATVSVVVLPTGAGYLTSHLPGLGMGRTYQLWAQTPTAVVSLGVLGPTPRLVAFTMVGSTTRLMVTDEAAGGVARTEQVPVAAGDLPA